MVKNLILYFKNCQLKFKNLNWTVIVFKCFYSFPSKRRYLLSLISIHISPLGALFLGCLAYTLPTLCYNRKKIFPFKLLAKVSWFTEWPDLSLLFLFWAEGSLSFFDRLSWPNFVPNRVILRTMFEIYYR